MERTTRYDTDVRMVNTGTFWSVQVCDIAVAPGSGWYEVAAFDDEPSAWWLTCRVREWISENDGAISPLGARTIGGALAKAREVAHAAGVAAGVVRERKRWEAMRRG
jgi:hypothetical protein